MLPTTGSALIILVAFVLPGFVTVLLQELTFKSAEDPTPLDRLLRIIAYSVWTYLLIAMGAIALDINEASFLHWYHDHTGDPAQLVWRGVLLVIVPSLIITLVTFWWSRSRFRDPLMERLGLNPRHRQPTAWDYYFRQARHAYVRATFGDGSRVLGYYGRQSFSAYSKDGQDLFLEKEYLPNNTEDYWFGAEAPGTCGVWVKAQDAVCVEFYSPKRSVEQKREPETPAPASPEARGAPASATEPGQTPTAAATTATEEGAIADAGQQSDAGERGQSPRRPA